MISELYEWLERWAVERSAEPAYVRVCADGSRAVLETWGSLANRVRVEADRFAREHAAGARVLVEAGEPQRAAVGVLGALAAGLSVMPVGADVPEGRVRELCGRLGAVDARGGVAQVHTTWASRGKTVRGELLLSSSGTTGEPRVVARGVGALDAVAGAMAGALRLDGESRVLAVVPRVIRMAWSTRCWRRCGRGRRCWWRGGWTRGG